MVKLSLEILEQAVRHAVLELSRQLIIEVELLNDDIIVVHKSILDVLLNLIVKFVRQVLSLVTVFKPQHPQVKLVQVLIDHSFKTLFLRKHNVNGSR